MTFVKTVDEALAFVARQHKLLETKVDETIPAFKKLLDYPALPGLFKYSLEYVNNNGEYNSSSRLYHKPHDCKTIEAIEKRRDGLLAVCESVPGLLEDIRQQNLEIIEHNKKVVEKIKLFMSTVGIPSSFSTTDPKSRARNPKPITNSAGYLQDIGRNIRVQDAVYTSILSTVEQKKKTIQAWSAAAMSSIVEMEKATKAIEKQKKLEQLLAMMKIKYNLPFDADQREILDHIVDSNKYLRLADAMLTAREDFSECDGVENALNCFTIDDHTDKLIADDVNDTLERWDGDGRAFRDCEWNYGAVMSYAPADLVNDYNTLREYMGN